MIAETCSMVAAREAAHLTLEQAARKARVSTNYLKRYERAGGGCTLALAIRLSRIYGCPEWAFLKLRDTQAIPVEIPSKRAPEGPARLKKGDEGDSGSPTRREGSPAPPSTDGSASRLDESGVQL
jgi:transcriptional regulator with XRE-family HTH domain